MLLSLFLLSPLILSATAKGDGAKNHFKFYGFIRNYFAFDTRESNAGTGDLFYYLPLDKNMNEDGSQDLNAQPSFRFLSLTSRVGVDVYGYHVGKTDFGAKVEADFYAGLSNAVGGTKINGTAQLRLRQAYLTIGWNDLPLTDKSKASVSLKLGQAWHPLAADQPHVTGLETGTPFNPFSRTPMVLMDASLGKNFMISAGAIWQMQYLSQGPLKATADYIKYAGTPEGYVGFTFKSNNGFLARLGMSVLSIKPRRVGEMEYTTHKNPYDVKVKTVRVSDRITTFNPYIYLQYKAKKFEFKAKSVYSQAGEHINLMSGYGISSTDFDDGHYSYTPLQASTSWASVSYGKKWQVMLMGGYMKNLGSLKPFVTDKIEGGVSYVEKSNVYFNGNGSSNLNSMWRIIPAVAYNIGKFTIALEYNLTAAQYGKYKSISTVDGDKTVTKQYLPSRDGLAKDDLHWVYNNRIQMMVKFSF